ncbi:hypothetical protein [Aquabacterium sp.]|uniref:hypothetical protein n=1 Tax=Aquabacterium sp. TaxID=1872578 RepID=UPI003783E089
MSPTFLAAVTLALAAGCTDSIAQAYEFRQGYIFDQRYVERISVSQAEKIANTPKLFEPLMSFDWTQQKEAIKDPRVKRIGDRLVLSFGGGAKLSLKNFSAKQGDGDSQIFKYIKSIPGYHIVGVEYGHDQPQFLLVSESGAHVYFVNTN